MHSESPPPTAGEDLTTPTKRRRGFAAMSAEKMREIAELGGRAAHATGNAHRFSADKAREAGRLGGIAVSEDRAHMAAIGRRGGEQRSARMKERRAAAELPLVLPGPALPLLVAFLLLFASPSLTAAQPMPASTPAPAVRALHWVLPRAPLGAHCVGSVVCTEMGTWGVHARLSGSTLIRDDRSVPGGMLTPALSFTLGGWGEVGAHFPILLGPIGTSALPLPPLLFGKGTFTPPHWIGTHGVVFGSLTLPGGPFTAPDEQGRPMARRYEVGAAISGRLLWMLHYGLSMSGQLSPGGAPSRLLTGLEVEARFDGPTPFAQVTHSAAFCWDGSPDPGCQSSVMVLGGLRIPIVFGHSSAAAGPVRGARESDGTVIAATVGLSYDETTRAKYGDGIEAMKRLWVRLFNAVIDPYLDERCVLWDDDHTIMTDLGRKSADGQFCERDGLRTPIGTHFDRNQANTRVCYDKGLRNCILQRRSDKDAWEVVPPDQQARRPYLKDNCHVHDAEVPLPLQQVGVKSADGNACEWQGHRFPIGTKFWAVPGANLMCQDPTLRDCSLELPPKPMSAGQYVASRAEQGIVGAVQKLLNDVERTPPVAKDLASGELHVDTIAGEAANSLKEDLGHLSVEDAKKKAQAIVETGKEWLEKPLHEQLGDLAEAATGGVVTALESEATAGLGNLASGVAGVARV